MDSSDLLTPEEAAKVLKMHPVTVRRLLRAGTLPGQKVGPRQWRISAAALQRYVEGGSTRSSEQSPNERQEMK